MSLAYGKVIEREIAGEFKSAGWDVIRRDRKTSDLLVTCGNRGEIIEAKNEDAHADSANACVEMVQVNRVGEKVPSGLWVTEASVMVHSFGANWILYRAKQMLIAFQCQWMGEGKESFFRSNRPFGDNGNSGFFVRKNWLLRQSWADQVSKGRLPHSRLFRMS